MALFMFCFLTTLIRTLRVCSVVLPFVWRVLAEGDHFGFVVAEGDRIAQLIIERIETPEVLEVEVLVSYRVYIYIAF